MRREGFKKAEDYGEGEAGRAKKTVKLIFCAGPDGAETCSDKR